MSRIVIQRSHKKPVKEAKAAVERVAEKIVERFDVEYGWDGNTLNFERSGVHGSIELKRGEVCVTVNLSFLLLALRGPIEREIHRQIDIEFA